MEEQQLQSTVYKKLFFGLLILITAITIGGSAYFIGKNQTTKNSSLTPTVSVPTLYVSPDKSSSNSSEAENAGTNDENIVPVSLNSVSFARSEGKTYLRYRGKIYDDSDQNNPREALLTIPDKTVWYGLVDAPSYVTPGEFMLDEMFGFKVAPDMKSFAFIMRWGDKNAAASTTTYSIYYYDPQKSQKLSLLRKFSPSIDGSYPVPKINQFSPDGAYLSFNMHACWNCGATAAETLLMRLSDNSEKRIGRSSYFAWKTNGAYEYKEYVVILCSPPPGGEVMAVECFEKPESLPLKTGQF